jgi:hypothetical protein
MTRTPDFVAGGAEATLMTVQPPFVRLVATSAQKHPVGLVDGR